MKFGKREHGQKKLRHFEFQYQMCEFLVHSKELKEVLLSIKSAHLSFQCIIDITGKVFLQKPLIVS